MRQIWGKGDTILFIFAGASAEFALNKAVDWLYYTGRLPADPLGRLFSTVSYSRKIVFAELGAANKAIDQMRAIHTAVEKSRNATIPDWAYRDVLFMLIHYSIAAYEVLERKLSFEEKEEVFNVFNRVGLRMKLVGLPATYTEWLTARENHLAQNLQRSLYTKDLFRQYKKHLGAVRYHLLCEVQVLVVPRRVQELLHLRRFSYLQLIIPLYKFSRKLRVDGFLRDLLLPKNYKQEIRNLDIPIA